MYTHLSSTSSLSNNSPPTVYCVRSGKLFCLITMLSPMEMVVLAGVGLFFFGRKEGLRLVKQSGRTLGKFWKEASKVPDVKGTVKKEGGTSATTKPSSRATREEKD